MIKCNVTVCGTVCRQAQMRANKEGKQFISFGISVVVRQDRYQQDCRNQRGQGW